MANKANKRQKRAARKRGGKVGVMGLMCTPAILPSLFRGHMFYQTNVTLGPAAGGIAVNVFRANSVFDPDLTNAGTVAAGYAALAGLYGRYRVLSSSVKLTYNNQGSIPFVAFVAANPVTTIGTSFATAMAQRYTWQAGLGGASGTGYLTHSFGVRMAKVYGVPEVQVRNEDDFAAVTGSNPNNGVYYHVGVFNPSGAASSCTVAVRIDYEVVWSLPLEFAQ